ncbi:hypothetical protein HF086_016789 [Spodoptera exigua]|uniref:Uncharacterized protein n=1 Tax=Spodoptera exigua TaxID=7107 RepID=A0A922SIM4_SPOEX|nr:hypothetical protein HF086_016789 [Spodoptera exigua]
MCNTIEVKTEDTQKEVEDCPCMEENEPNRELEEHLNLETDRIIVQAKIRTPKRQRKDSATDKDKEEQKKFKLDDSDKLINIEETAIDGIELMASYKVKFRIRPKKRGGSIYTLVMDKDAEEPKIEESKTEEPSKEEETKPDIDVDLALRQIRKGWSAMDAGDLTIGDLYLMFGSRSKLELDYWWAEPTPPLPQPQKSAIPVPTLPPDKRDKSDKMSDKGADSSVEDEKERARESDNDILSPKNTFSQDSNDGMSGDERKCEQLASPDHKSSSGGGTLKLVSKLINRPQAPQSQQNGFAVMSDRLRRLLCLVGNPHVGGAAGAGTGGAAGAGGGAGGATGATGARFGAVRDPVGGPAPLAARPAPPGRPTRRRAEAPAATAQTARSRVSIVYVVSESNGQYFFHDGNRRIPIVAEKPHQPIVITEFLSSESMSLSPSRLLQDAEGWLDAAEHDFSLTSFLGHLEGRPNVDSHLQSLMAESSVDYVAKFADLAAEVTDEPDHATEEPT